MVEITKEDLEKIKAPQLTKGQEPTLLSSIDKFLTNEKVQESIAKVIGRFSQKKASESQPQIPYKPQNEENIISSFINRLYNMGQGKKTVEDIKKEFDKLENVN